MAIKRLKDGDKIDGSKCVVGARLAYCDGCECVRVFGSEWTRETDEWGFTGSYCGRHVQEETDGEVTA